MSFLSPSDLAPPGRPIKTGRVVTEEVQSLRAHVLRCMNGGSRLSLSIAPAAGCVVVPLFVFSLPTPLMIQRRRRRRRHDLVSYTQAPRAHVFHE